MNSNKDYSRWIIGGGIFVAVVILIFSLFSKNNAESPSDCSRAELFDANIKKCRLITKDEYLEGSKKDIDNAVSDMIHDNFKDGSLCIPADETPKYVGVNGCVRMFVKSYYIASYGWAWLDAQQISYENGDFGVAALGRGIISKADADYYHGKWISVHGTISLYDGETQIIIDSKSAITDVSQENTPYLTQYSNLEEEYEKEITKKIGDCFESRIKNASTKSQKDNVYYECRVSN